jgi:hypothetical protein
MSENVPPNLCGEMVEFHGIFYMCGYSMGRVRIFLLAKQCPELALVSWSTMPMPTINSRRTVFMP